LLIFKFKIFSDFPFFGVMD